MRDYTIGQALVIIARAIVIAACVMTGNSSSWHYYGRRLTDGQP